MGNNDHLWQVVHHQEQGIAHGIYSICSANPLVIEACMRHALVLEQPVLIESTSNQINQFGGYTGLTPEMFHVKVMDIAQCVGFPTHKIILGGDHLGPNAWQDQPAAKAMQFSRELVRAYVQAGFTKIHLDASMCLADDPQGIPLQKQTSAERAAEMCQVAEETAQTISSESLPVYIIGTEVPIPGGAQHHEDRIHITGTQDAAETIEITRAAFENRHLEQAWQRVIGLVVQPGVEFGDDQIFEYQRPRAQELSRLITQYPHLVYEAHSTDFQTGQALKEMVEDHFAILKVGPGLTFAFREAVFSLSQIEREWLSGRSATTLSNIIDLIETEMLQEPLYWKKYYHGSENELGLARRYSYSDRIRYYWPHQEIQQALQHLIQNLDTQPPPLTLISQYMPLQYQHIRDGQIKNTPLNLIFDKVMEVCRTYTFACNNNK